MKKIALCIAALVSTQAFALDLGVFGTVGYSNMKNTSISDSDAQGGLNVGAVALSNVLPFNDMLGLAVGAGLNYTRVTYEKNSVTSRGMFLHVVPEVGLNIQLSPDFRVIPTFNFAWGASCKSEVEVSSVVLSSTLDSCNQYGLNARAAYSIMPQLVGIGQLQYDIGQTKINSASSDYRVYALSVGAGYQF